MKKLMFCIIIAFFISGCARANTNTAAKFPNSLTEISGNWDVVRFDEFLPIRLNGLGERTAYVDISEKFIRLKMTCNTSGISALLTTGYRLVKNPDGLSARRTAIDCPDMKKEHDFMAMMYNSPLVEVLPNGRL